LILVAHYFHILKNWVVFVGHTLKVGLAWAIVTIHQPTQHQHTWRAIRRRFFNMTRKHFKSRSKLEHLVLNVLNVKTDPGLGNIETFFNQCLGIFFFISIMSLIIQKLKKIKIMHFTCRWLVTWQWLEWWNGKNPASLYSRVSSLFYVLNGKIPGNNCQELKGDKN